MPRVSIPTLIALLVFSIAIATPMVSASDLYLEIVLGDGTTLWVNAGDLEPGDALLLHSKKLVLNGSGYIEFPHSDKLNSVELSVVARVKPFQHPDWNAVVSKDELGWRLYVSQVSDRWDFSRKDGAGSTYVAEDGVAEVGRGVWLAAVSNSTHLALYIDGELRAVATWSGEPAALPHPLLVGVNSYNGSVMWAQAWVGEIDMVLIYSRALSGNEMKELANGLVPGENLVLLFDPSLFNGSAFYGLYAYGIPRGSIQLENDVPKVLVIKELFNDDRLHLLGFQNATVRLVYGSTPVLEFRISSVDFSLPWPPAVVVKNIENPTAPSSRLVAYTAIAIALAAFAAAPWILDSRVGLLMGVASILGSVIAVVACGMEQDLAARSLGWIYIAIFTASAVSTLLYLVRRTIVVVIER